MINNRSVNDIILINVPTLLLWILLEVTEVNRTVNSYLSMVNIFLAKTKI